MITISKIGYMGRIANQMFQYAMLMGVSHKTGYQIKIPRGNTESIKPDGCLDLFTGKWIPYRFDLPDCFDIDIQWMEDSERVLFKNQYKEKHFHFDFNVFSVPDFTDFDGYFQSIKYFEDIMPQIRETFKFKKEIQNKALNFHDANREDGSEIVAIHVRRGDYLGIPDILPVREPEYFEEAFSYFTDKPYKFLVCSDDIQWCINTFGNSDNIFYPVDNDPYTDLCAMSMCDHFIISNSTFGLWAALLNNKPNKKVISPKNWFGPKLAHNNTKDLMPENWIRI